MFSCNKANRDLEKEKSKQQLSSSVRKLIGQTWNWTVDIVNKAINCVFSAFCATFRNHYLTLSDVDLPLSRKLNIESCDLSI